MPTKDRPTAPRRDRFSADQDKLGPYGTWPFVDRRVVEDRRYGRTKLFSRYMAFGRRAAGRRRGEAHNIYVDRYQSMDVLLAVAILVLNILDAIFTLQYVGNDLAREANPFARYLLELGYGWFIFGKAVVVAVCVLFLAAHKTFRFVRPALQLLFAFYFLLLLYHFYLKVVAPVPHVV